MEFRMTRPASDPLPSIWNPDQRIGDMLKGKRRLVVGIANAHYRAALEASVRYAAAAELGERRRRRLVTAAVGPRRPAQAAAVADALAHLRAAGSPS